MLIRLVKSMKHAARRGYRTTIGQDPYSAFDLKNAVAQIEELLEFKRKALSAEQGEQNEDRIDSRPQCGPD